jgi:hypothetical protein
VAAVEQERLSERGCNVGITEEGFYRVFRWVGLRWYGTHFKFYVEFSRRSSDIKAIILTSLEATMLVTVMRGIYEVRH